MNESDFRHQIAVALSGFSSCALRESSLGLLGVLGYRSDRTLSVPGSTPQAFLELFVPPSFPRSFDQEKALVAEWKTVDLLFQLTDQELSRESSLFTETSVNAGLLKSYVFIAIELIGSDYPRGKFSAITRQVNRIFPMPVMVLFKHHDRLTIAVINRRVNKIDESRDVLGKVTLIRDINFLKPHRGHLDILLSFAFPNLVHPQRIPINNFDALHAAWEQIFNVELLNERFYRELANWYFWALPQVQFPADLEPDDEKRRATGLIRLLTRLIFCWFLKEKGLIPENLFNPTDLARVLNGFNPESETSSTYYYAILQNLFFATLNQRMDKDAKGQPYRQFVLDEGFLKNRSTHDLNNLYRYEKLFREGTEAALALFADIPFLNGGLFECLDKRDEDREKTLYFDGFSRNANKRPVVPDRLFFDGGETADLSAVYEDKKRKAEKVTGLIRILNRYKFTIVENTPIDQEIALDPELLGKVFENLLASYNEETRTTARKQTGSFYTPRPIVDYMVDESLKAHLTRVLVEKAGMDESAARAGLDLLFAYTEKEQLFSDLQTACLITAVDSLKILDPACGSGAFPMGVLHKLVHILSKLDPLNERWEQIRVDEAQKIPDPEERRRKIMEIASNFQDNNDDYGRKLYLIENCLYGVDIQPIAIQITKLRFFISLVCDQKTNRNKKENHGIRPLPNLETKFVAADSLIALPEMTQSLLVDPRVGQIEKEIGSLYHTHFSIQRRDQKLALQRKIKSLRQELAKLLAESLMAPKKAQHVAEWDPFDPQSTADFFDPHWMFGRSLADGFHVVLGNPPYVFGGNTGISEADKKRYKEMYLSGTGKINLFTIFIERGSQLLAPNGILSYITPNTLLRVTSYKRIRDYMLKNLKVEEVLDLDVGVFAEVTASTIAIRLRRQLPDSNWTAKIKHGIDDDTAKSHKQADWLAEGGIIDIFSNQEDRDILVQLESEASSLGQFCHRIRFGVVISGNFSQVVSDEKRGLNWKPFLEGDEIGPYSLHYRGRYLNYDPSLLHRARTPDVFECRKIMIQRITGGQNPLKATLDEDHFYNKESILNIILKDSEVQKYEFVLAVLNSKVANWFYRKRFTNNSKLTVNLSKEYIGQIPIKLPPPQGMPLFAKLVRLVLMLKRIGDTARAHFLEDVIDACVMECYFREHMAARGLLFIDDLTPHFAAHTSAASEAQQRDFLSHLHATLNGPSHPIRNRLLRLSADSPDLLAVIREECKE